MARISNIRLPTEGGFTMVELVAIVVLVGILAFSVIPRYQDRGAIDVSAKAEQLANDIRYAQSLAMTSGQHDRINLAAASYQITTRGYARGASGDGILRHRHADHVHHRGLVQQRYAEPEFHRTGTMTRGVPINMHPALPGSRDGRRPVGVPEAVCPGDRALRRTPRFLLIFSINHS